jgi:hypothetical protein
MYEYEQTQLASSYPFYIYSLHFQGFFVVAENGSKD